MLTRAEHEILSSGTEDWTGLWEVIWRFRVVFPEMNEDQTAKLALISVRRLLERGFIELCHWDMRTNTDEPIDAALARTLLERPSSWQTPTEDVQVRFFATEASERAYQATDPSRLDRPLTF